MDRRARVDDDRVARLEAAEDLGAEDPAVTDVDRAYDGAAAGHLPVIPATTPWASAMKSGTLVGGMWRTARGRDAVVGVVLNGLGLLQRVDGLSSKRLRRRKSLAGRCVDAVRTEVFVVSTDASVLSTEVFVGSTCVFVEPTDVFVGSTDVFVGPTGALVASTGCLRVSYLCLREADTLLLTGAR